MTASTSKTCKDCERDGITTKRKVDKPGPRCVTHWRVVVKARKERTHELHVQHVYGLSAEDYTALYDDQGGRCFVCQRATGAARRLAVDHQHDRPGCRHQPDIGCRECVRCLACKTCNRIILGRYSVDALKRAIIVLSDDPPARRVLRKIMEVK
jgi:hypothetical protein